MIEVDGEEELEGKLKINRRVFALFYASWCPFCGSFLPVFEKYARENNSEEFLQVKIDDEMNPLWEEYNIQIVPAVILFEGERLARRLDGRRGIGLSEEELKIFLESAK